MFYRESKLPYRIFAGINRCITKEPDFSDKSVIYAIRSETLTKKLQHLTVLEFENGIQKLNGIFQTRGMVSNSIFSRS